MDVTNFEKRNNKMNKNKSIKKNAVLNAIKVGLSVVFPLITFPYASRVLQAEYLGKVNYGASIISYFSLLAALGVTNYAVREGSKIREDKVKMSKFSSEVFTVNLITTIFSYFLLILLLILTPGLNDYILVILIQSLSMIFAVFGVEWLNAIYEDYAYITIRSVIVHIISLICLFTLVKTPDDYLFYAGLTVLSNGLICVSNWFHCRRYVKLQIRIKCNFWRHIKPMAIFFSNSLAVSIYVNSDMTMVGWFVGDYYTGLYSVSVKIYQIIKQLLTAIYTVAIPRLSKASGNSDLSEFRRLITDICSVLALLIFPAMVGLIAIAKEIVILISGYSYIEATLSLQLLGIALVFAVVGGILVNCINTPLGKEKVSLKATITAAIINIALNIVLIPLFKQNGAALTTVISEIIVCAVCFKNLGNVHKYVNVGYLLRQVGFSVLGCLWIIFIKAIVSQLELGAVSHVCVVILGSCIGYFVILIIFKNPYYLIFKNIVRKQFKR